MIVPTTVEDVFQFGRRIPNSIFDLAIIRSSDDTCVYGMVSLMKKGNSSFALNTPLEKKLEHHLQSTK
jgi:hypothetical protein